MPHSITRLGDIEFSDGPDRAIGGHQCADQHDGITREGHRDSCCCCDPCRYIRPPFGSSNRFCCRCTPKMVCMTFTPDDLANECCRSISLPILPAYTSTPFHSINYIGTISGITFRLSIAKEADDGPCYWQVSSGDAYVDDRIEIDHVYVSCLSVPDISVSGVVDDHGCVGTITFANFEAANIPYQHNVSPELLAEYARMVVPHWQHAPYPECNCAEVPKYLCVDGILQIGGSREQFTFIWDEDLGDRWSYLPCGGDPTVDQKHIYLRGDHYGNCYLEFDFDQAGSNTNDWGIPPNTLGVDIHEIREGMIPVESCGCDIHAHDVRPDNPPPTQSSRFINITAGDCGCWKYRCGTCRCVPQRVCVIGEIDGEHVDGEAIWNGEGWVFSPAAASVYVGSFLVRIGPNVCDDCVLTVEGTFAVAFGASTPVACGEFLAGEIQSVYDETVPGAFNWIWISAAACPCNVVACGICEAERCGGPPKIVYMDLEGRTIMFPPDPYRMDYCNITVVMNYFQRWYTAGSVARIQCGYIGYQPVNCPATAYQSEENFVIRVSVSDDGFGQAIYQVDRFDIADPTIYANIIPSQIWPPIGSSPATCDPFLFVKDWDGTSQACRWGCGDLGPYEKKITFTE